MAVSNIGQVSSFSHKNSESIELACLTNLSDVTCHLCPGSDDVIFARFVTAPIQMSLSGLVVSGEYRQLVQEASCWQCLDVQRHGLLGGLSGIVEPADTSICVRKVRVGVAVRGVPLNRLVSLFNRTLEIPKKIVDQSQGIHRLEFRRKDPLPLFERFRGA